MKRIVVLMPFMLSIVDAQVCAQPPATVTNGSVSSFPRSGWRIRDNTSDAYAPAMEVKVAFCDVGAEPENCPFTGSDSSFSALQITSMKTAISNWSAARSTNGSMLEFKSVDSIAHEILTVPLKKKNSNTMSTAVGLTQPGQWKSVDKNGDGVHDTYRMSNREIWMSSALGNSEADWTSTFAHELGHTMGLDNCTAACDSVMTVSWTPPLPLGPTGCDNSKIATYMQ